MSDQQHNSGNGAPPEPQTADGAPSFVGRDGEPVGNVREFVANLEESNDRLAQKIEDYERRLAAYSEDEKRRETAAAKRRGDWDSLEKSLREEMNAERAQLVAYRERVETTIRSRQARSALSRHGITDPEVLDMLAPSLAQSAGGEWDPDRLQYTGDFDTSAAALVAKLLPAPAKDPKPAPARVAAVLPDSQVTETTAEHWRDKLHRRVREM